MRSKSCCDLQHFYDDLAFARGDRAATAAVAPSVAAVGTAGSAGSAGSGGFLLYSHKVV